MKHKVGLVKIDYELVVGGKRTSESFASALWLERRGRRAKLSFVFSDYKGVALLHRVLSELRWEYKFEGGNWIIYTNKPLDGMKRLIELGWVEKPEARAKLVALLLLEEGR